MAGECAGAVNVLASISILSRICISQYRAARSAHTIYVRSPEEIQLRHTLVTDIVCHYLGRPVHNVVLVNGEPPITSINCSNNYIRSGTGSLFVIAARSFSLVHCDLLRTSDRTILPCLSVAAILAVSHSNILDNTAFLGALFAVEASVCEISHSVFAHNVFTTIIDSVSMIYFRNCQLDSAKPDAERLRFNCVRFAVRDIRPVGHTVDCDCFALESGPVPHRAMLLQDHVAGGGLWMHETFPRPHQPDVRPEHDDKDDPVFRYENVQEDPDARGFRLRQIVVQRSDDEGDALPVLHEERIQVQKQKAVFGKDGPWTPKLRRAILHQVPEE
jgi:hypothetical protein